MSSRYILCGAGEWFAGTTPFTQSSRAGNCGEQVNSRFTVQWAVR